MAIEFPDGVDWLHPDPADAAGAWAARVRARRAQAERHSQVEPGTDAYARMARQFDRDPDREDDQVLEILRAEARADDTWLDIGAGGGRYALPLARVVARVVAVEPSAAMREVLRSGMRTHGIDNIVIDAGDWPDAAGRAGPADVSLVAHVGYETEDMSAFLEAAERQTRRHCVVVMREGGTAAPGHQLWTEVHGEDRILPPMLPELLALLLARGVVPEVSLAERSLMGYADRELLLEVARRQLRLRAGSDLDARLTALVEARASERDGRWAVEWIPMRDGIVTWEPRAS